jgi:hypothetical protein
MHRQERAITATFPVDDRRIAVVFSSPSLAEAAATSAPRLVSGRDVILHGVRDGVATQILLECDVPSESGLVIDQVIVEEIRQDIDGPELELGPRFIHGVRAPMDFKVPYLDPQFPFSSTLAGLHASVACCTGCNGGVHDRGLVVLTNHTGGSWSGIWVQTAQSIPEDYRRWQKVEFHGGVLRDDFGSIAVVDEGWMQVRLGDETSHAAPPPARITASDLPAEGTRSLLAYSLDASWVEFADVSIIDLTRVEAASGGGKVRLPRVEARFSDTSGSEAISWLYQRSAFDLSPGDHLATLRGFVHAEAPGRYVLLSDKEEDLLR